MNKKTLFIFCLTAILTLLPVLGYGGYISMVIQTTITASPQKVEVEITLQNKGDEAAYKIYPELQLGSSEAKLSPQQKMAVNDSRQWSHAFSPEEAGLKLNGTYPLLITLHYHDSNMYPASTPEIVLFEMVKAGKELPFESKIETSEVLDFGQVSLTLGNVLDRTLVGEVRVLLPIELTTENNSSTFELQANQTSQILFPITNKGALPGSKYKIFSITEFNDSGRHYCVLVSDMISVKMPKDEDSFRFLMIGGGSLIILLLLLIVFWELRRREN